MVATTTASVVVVASTSAFVVAAFSFISLSDGKSVDSLAEGGERSQYFLQIAFVSGANLREREDVLVIFCWMEAVTAIVITSFTSFTHYIA